MDTIDEGLQVDYKYYSSEDENKYKIIAIKFKKLSK
jgi:ASC-1-like (ASCH) protein